MPNMLCRQIQRVLLQMSLRDDVSVQVASEKRTHGLNRRRRIKRAQGARSCVQRRVTPVLERHLVLRASLDWFCSDVPKGVRTVGIAADDLSRQALIESRVDPETAGMLTAVAADDISNFLLWRFYLGQFFESKRECRTRNIRRYRFP